MEERNSFKASSDKRKGKGKSRVVAKGEPRAQPCNGTK